jgi:hypothetical protein
MTQSTEILQLKQDQKADISHIKHSRSEADNITIN